MNFNNAPTNTKMDYYKIRVGMNRVRFFGGILPRRVYWVKDAALEYARLFENLRINRDTGRMSQGRDPVLEYFPQARDFYGNLMFQKNGNPTVNKAKFGYVSLAVDMNDPDDPKICIFPHKQTLFEHMQAIGRKLKKDPTDLDDGFDVYFTRTGDKLDTTYKVEEIECLNSIGPVDDNVRELIEEYPETIEKLFPLETPEEQEARLIELTKLIENGGDASKVVEDKEGDTDNIPF